MAPPFESRSAASETFTKVCANAPSRDSIVEQTGFRPRQCISPSYSPVMLLFLATAAAVPLSLLLVYWSLQPPRNFAPGLPVVPLWVAFLPLLRSWLGLPLPGQDETYARYVAPRMARHGAVVVFFGSRWNVLVACPQGMKQLFAQERTLFQKQGNHRKLPDAVISALTGGNIISETGALWRKYAQVIRPALKDHVDASGLDTAAARLVAELDGHKGSVTPLVQRYSMEAVSLCVLGRDLKVGRKQRCAADASSYPLRRRFTRSTPS